VSSSGVPYINQMVVDEANYGLSCELHTLAGKKPHVSCHGKTGPGSCYGPTRFAIHAGLLVSVPCCIDDGRLVVEVEEPAGNSGRDALEFDPVSTGAARRYFKLIRAVKKAWKDKYEPKAIWVVEQQTLPGWENTWHDDKDREQTFPTQEQAKLALTDHIQACKDSVKLGLLSDAPKRSEFRIRNLKAI